MITVNRNERGFEESRNCEKCGDPHPTLFWSGTYQKFLCRECFGAPWLSYEVKK